MRMGVQVNHQDVLAVMLSEVANYLTFPIPNIVQAAVKGGLGYSNVSEDFLTPNAATTYGPYSRSEQYKKEVHCVHSVQASRQHQRQPSKRFVCYLLLLITQYCLFFFILPSI